VALYEGRGLGNEVHLVHCENIPERSSLHDWEIEPHVHDAMLQILYVTRGGGEVFIDDRIWTLEPPCLVVIPAQRVHGFHWDRRIDGPVITAAQRPLEALLDVLAPELRAVLREPRVLDVAPQGRHGEALMPLFDAIAREVRTTGLGGGVAALSLLAALVVQVARIAQAGVGAPGDPRSRKALHIERFRALLDMHFRERWPVARYAREIGVTPGQLGRLCRELLGMSPLDAINARVLAEAQRSLVYSTLSIKQVAAELGFDDEAYFGRFFKKQAGAQPTAFRVAGRRMLVGAAARPT
jgi:AraC family transcriptional activator of pobA